MRPTSASYPIARITGHTVPLSFLASLRPVPEPQFPTVAVANLRLEASTLSSARDGRLAPTLGSTIKGRRRWGRPRRSSRSHRGPHWKEPCRSGLRPIALQRHRLDFVGRQHQGRHVVIGSDQVARAHWPSIGIRWPIRSATSRYTVCRSEDSCASAAAVTGRMDRRRICMIWNKRSARRIGMLNCCLQDGVSRPCIQELSRRRSDFQPDRKD